MPNAAQDSVPPRLTNVEQSHQSMLPRFSAVLAGERLFDVNTNSVSVLDEEYRKAACSKLVGFQGHVPVFSKEGTP